MAENKTDSDTKGDGLVGTSPFSDDTGIGHSQVENSKSNEEIDDWEEKAEEVDAPETSKEIPITGDALADIFMAEFLKGEGEGDGDDEPRLGRGVTLDKEQFPEGEDYSVGRWVAFPNAKMSGKVRQIVDHAPSECGFMAYWLTSPELEPSNRFKTVGMKLNGNKSFGTKEEAEKYIYKPEGEFRKKILQIVTKDSLTDDKIFDPERFDQNSFEWGAIYWINQIRDAVEEFEDGYVVPDEQFTEMLRPLKKCAQVYAEAHGKHKKWVKNTVLSVPNAFANAFDTLSDGEGVSKEHFLKVLTVEGVCALAEGDIDSVHELEDYYYRKGIYAPRSGYEVGRFVVIIKDPPSPKYESERIRHIIAIRGEKGDDDPTLVFWNTSKSGIVERKASQCSKPFHKCDDAYDWWFVENGDGARSLKKSPLPEKDGGLSAARDILKLGGDMNAIADDAIEDVFGIGQDTLDPNDPLFWAKHNKARHGGHFDPDRQTCKLREKAQAAEEQREQVDERDDIQTSDAPEAGNKIANAMLIGTKVIQENRKYDPTKDNSELDLKELHNENTGDVVGLYDRATNTVRLFDGADVNTLVHELGGHATMQFAEQCAAAGNDTLLKKIYESIDTAPPEVWNKVRKSYHQLNNESDKDYEERLRDEVWAAVVEGKSKTIEEVKKTEQGSKWWKKAWNTVKACWAGILGRMGVQVDWASDKVKNMSPDKFQEFIVNAVKEGRNLGSIKPGKDSGLRQMAIKQDEYEQWNKILDEFEQRHVSPHTRLTVLKETPIVLQRVGANNLPIHISGGVLQKIVGEIETKTGDRHGVPISELRGLQIELDNPIAVFDSATQPDSLVVLTRMVDAQNNERAVVALRLDREASGNHTVNDIASIYGKSKNSVINWAKTSLLRYVNKRARRESARWLQLPGDSTLRARKVMTEEDFQGDELGHIVPNNAEDVKSPRSSVVKMAMGQDSAEHRMVEFRELMAKKFPGIDAMAVLQIISKMGSPEAMAAEFRRILDSGKIV